MLEAGSVFYRTGSVSADAGSAGSEETTGPEILKDLELDLEWKVWGKKNRICASDPQIRDLYQCLHPIGPDLALCSPSSLINQIMKQGKEAEASQTGDDDDDDSEWLMGLIQHFKRKS